MYIRREIYPEIVFVYTRSPRSGTMGAPPVVVRAGYLREVRELAARTELAHAALRIWLKHMRQMRAPYERNMAKTRYWLQYRLMKRSDRPWNIFYLPGGVCPWDSDDPNSRVARAICSETTGMGGGASTFRR